MTAGAVLWNGGEGHPNADTEPSMGDVVFSEWFIEIEKSARGEINEPGRRGDQ